jgi:hypothetical protein
MSSINLVATQAQSDTFSFPAAVFSENGIYSAKSQGASGSLLLGKFVGTIPVNSTLTGIVVTVVGLSTGSVTLNGYFGLPNNFSQTRSVTVSSSGTYSMGSSSDTWGAFSSDFNGNYTFYLNTFSTPALNLDYIFVTLYYTVSNYLAGSRSVFNPSSSTSFDVVPVKSNGYSLSNQVKSEDLNLIGDCLFNIESAVVASIGLLRSVGAPSNDKLYVFSMTVTGVVTGSAPLFYERSNSNSIINTSSNLATTAQTITPQISGLINCNFVSAIGWVTQGAKNIPVYVSPRCFYISSGNYYLSFSAVGSGIVSSVSNSVPSPTTAFQGYIGSSISSLSPVPSGNITIKLLAIGHR